MSDGACVCRQLPKDVVLEDPVRHLVLCVHGIGVHDGNSIHYAH